MPYVFYSATKDALNSITNTFDFVHPLRASLLYTRSKVSELLRIDHITNIDIQKIIDPTQKIHGVNYIRAFSENTLENQEELLAWLLLNDIFAIHEGWAARLYLDAFSGLGFSERTFVKNLEFPGFTLKLTSYYLTSGKKSLLFEKSFYPNYKACNKYSSSKLENYLKCYRYFKEMRNCYMHGNQIVSQELIDAYSDYLAIANESDLDVSEVPQIIEPILGNSVRLSLRGVIGFSDIVRRIMILCDTEFTKSKAAEIEFMSRVPVTWTTHTFNSEEKIRKRQVTSFIMKAGFIKPIWNDDLKDWVISKGYFSR